MENEIEIAQNKIILLYALSKTDKPISANRFVNMFLESSLMNYFVLQENISQLINDNYINAIDEEQRTQYQITEHGKKINDYFNVKISKGIKKRLIEQMQMISEKTELDTFVIADYREIDVDVFEIELIIKERSVNLINLRLLAGTKKEAMSICEDFKKNYQEAYTHVLGFFIK